MVGERLHEEEPGDDGEVVYPIVNPLTLRDRSSRNTKEMGSNNTEELEKAFAELCLACRVGDIDTVDSLLSTPNLDINQVDDWDYSPLILASLCGHTRIVELLLSRGAVCDRDTFQGARCIYGALNDTIRDILISFDISKKVDMNQPFASHISSLLAKQGEGQISTSDIVFTFPGAKKTKYKTFYVHRFILAARSPYFSQKLSYGGAWLKKTEIQMPDSTDPFIFLIIMDYIYLRTDHLPIDQKALQKQLKDFAKKLQLPDLLQSIDMVNQTNSKKDKAKIKHDVAFMFVEKARKDLDAFLQKQLLNKKLQVPLELGKEIDFEDISPQEHIDSSQITSILESNTFPDTIYPVVDIKSESVVYYAVHKAILARSEYFDTMFKSDIFLSSFKDLPWAESENIASKKVIDRPKLSSGNIPILQLSLNSSNLELTEIVLSYLYHDDVPRIPMPLSVDLLFIADELFLERLKTMAAVNITSQFRKFLYSDFVNLESIVGYNAFDLIRVSWLTRSDKLEQHITKLIAHNLKNIYEDSQQKPLFLSLILESALRIQERQDTDTIELIDDIRYYLSKKYSVNDDFAEFDAVGSQFQEDPSSSNEPQDIKIYRKAIIDYERDNEMIDSILLELNLDA